MEMASYADRTCASAMLKICQPKEGLEAAENVMDSRDDSLTDRA